MDPSLARSGLFLQALGLSLATEIPLLLACLRLVFRIGPEKISSSRILGAGLAATCFTLPLVWFLFPLLVSSPGRYEILSESFVVCAETLILGLALGLGPGRSLVASLLCNSGSFLMGRYVWEALLPGL